MSHACWLLPLALLCVPPSQAAADLVAAWDFDQVRGDIIPDRSGLSNDLTVRYATVVKGVSGQALSFDGREGQAVCLGGAPAAAGPGLTLEAWVRLQDRLFPSYPAVIRKEGHYALRFAGNHLGFIVWQAGRPQFCTSTRTDWPVGQWLHLVGTCANGELHLYVNGSEDARASLTGPVQTEATPLQCYVGSGPGNYFFRGDVDEVRILSHALPAAEVQGRYETGLAALAREKDTPMQPTTIGQRPAPFRKPPREVNMVVDGFLWVDAEDFADYGGWTLDTQFVAFMGSAYLLANGIGRPVADATTGFTLDKGGRYRLWVRCRNWLQEYSPGQFTVLLNGTAARSAFGRASSDAWLWEDGGEVELMAGANTIALHDLTGYYGRCDAILLTRDLAYRPPEKLDGTTLERGRLTGLSLAPRPRGEWDVIVVGAGAAGCCAAIASARNGARTALIQDRPVLGGNASTEAGVPINGAASCHANAREGGIIEEAGRLKARFGYPQMSRAFAELAAAEPNLTVCLNQRVVAARLAGPGRIAAVRAVDALTGETSEYAGRMFIDCTGDGWLGYYAGARFRLGREARSEFDESLAPAAADTITMSGCIMGGTSLSYRAADTGKPSPYTPPPWAPRFDSMAGYGRQIQHLAGGNWWMEHRGDVDDLWNPEQARDELIRITYGYWDYIKNRWEKKAEAAQYELVSVPIYDAKRETRRLIGDYLLTQNDCQAGKVFPDAVSYGGWPLDVHHPQGIYSAPEEGAFDTNAHVPIYTIPFRCLYSANVDNLLMAGRDVSVTHIALGSVRVQGTLAALGQAAGTAAALALRHQTTPRAVGQEHLAELQRLLIRQDQHIPGLAVPDPDNMAPQASRLACSSQADCELFGRQDVRPGDTHAMTCDRAMVLPAGERPRALELLLKSTRPTPFRLSLHVATMARADAFPGAAPQAVTSAADVPPGENWVRFDIPPGQEAPLLLCWLPQTEDLSWRLMKAGPGGSLRAYGDAAAGKWTPVPGQYYAVCAEPPLRVPGDFAVAHLTDGLTRPNAGNPGLWASDPAQPLPQWAELQFDRPVSANTVSLTFDTDVNNVYHDVALVPQCVRDYEVTGCDGREWRSLAKVAGNYQRHRVHHFPELTLTRLRLTVTGTNGVAAARVYEVRLYRE